MAYDSGRNRTVLFGGALQMSTSYTYYGDTWEFDGTTWTQINVSGPPPGGLGQMVYDSGRGVSVLFGGGDANGPLANITWEWNGSVWTPRFTTHRPPSRIWSGMTYDSTRHVVVLFGGGNVLPDTWEYDGNDWKQVLTAHSPSERYGHALAYDSIRGKTVLFGGHDNTTGRLNDTWEYNGSDWTQIVIGNPPAPRFWHSMSFAPALGKVVMFGGDYIVPGALGPNNETWLYDGTTWQQLTTATAPSPRSLAPVAWDAAQTSLVLFGGSVEVGAVQSLGDTWALAVPESAATLSASSVQFPGEPVLSTTSQDVTLTNTGTAPLTVSSIAAGGDFATGDNCPRAPATVAISGSCTVTVKFTPSSGDVPSSGTLTVNDNAPGGAQSIPLSGSGVWGQLQASSEPLAFAAAPINPSGVTASATETLTLPGPATILTGFTADIPWNVTNLNCPIGAQLGGGASCHVRVDFDPGTAGSYSGQVVIHDNEPGLRHPIAVSGTANPIPATVTVNLTTPDPMPTVGRTFNAQAVASSPFGSATFIFNGHQVGGPVDLAGTGSASVTIPLDDTTIPAGAGTYPLAVTVQPTDGVHSESAISQSVTVVPATVPIAWNGSTLVVAGNPVTLSVATSVPPATHQVWVRFDVTDSSRVTSTFYAQVASSGVASTTASTLAPRAFTVRASLVAATGSASPNAYVASKDLRAAFAVSPSKGGYVAGGAHQGPTTIGFEFTPGSIPGGSLAWVSLVQVTGTDGLQHEAWRIVSSTSVVSVSSHSHIATITGQATVFFVDTTSGSRLPGLDQSTPYQVTVAADGSVLVTINGDSASLPAGSGVNHL